MTRPMPTQPSSTLKGTMHMQKKRRNTSFRLQRELCSSLAFLSVPLFLIVFLSLSPTFVFSCGHCPFESTQSPQAEMFPKLFKNYYFLSFSISLYYIFTLKSFFSFWQVLNFSTCNLMLLVKPYPFSRFCSPSDTNT
ncbi:hypothetical protein CHARACLAT_004374 [Characodon lateralis]|uniref:Uncharacterized protein n=1 Tax=Characodon lateralis TaxID=208331 RepID=A0ABU7DN99_9TELE|nr:hypothetical protein [Characodon lateralis]